MVNGFFLGFGAGAVAGVEVSVGGGEEVVITSLVVPQHARLGQDVEMQCGWAAPQEHYLYSLKWYFNDLEFFRYIPEESPKMVIFNVSSINVNVSRPRSRFIIPKSHYLYL